MVLIRILKISWTEKRSNQEVLKMANVERSLINTIRKRQMKFIGHVYRNRGLEHLGLTGKIDGRRSRGRPRETYVDSLNTWATGKELSNNSFKKDSNERTQWRSMAVNACSRHDNR